MASKALFMFLCTIVCFIYVHSDPVDAAKQRGIVHTYNLKRTKMEPIMITKDSNVASLEIFCYEGVNSILVERLKRVFSSGRLHINTTGTEYQLFSGNNESSVFEAYSQARQAWMPWKKMVPWQAQTVAVPPFNHTCIGVSAAEQYAVIFIRNLIDPWLLMFFICGISLFFTADRLSRNVLFYYGTGISFGVLASLLILAFVLSRFVPWQKGVYATMVGGFAVVGWAFMQVWTNLGDLLQNHYQYVLGYLVTVGLVSFAVCYYKGPVQDPRSLNLIKWTVQLVAVSAIFLSMQVPEAALVVVLVLIAVYNFPTRFFSSLTKSFRQRFPSKRRLLTQEEYEREADEFTRRALEDLRTFCRSPNCDAWSTINRLDTPQRFAKWVEGESHLSDEELDMYDSDPHASYLPEVTDDEDEIDFRLNSL